MTALIKEKLTQIHWITFEYSRGVSKQRKRICKSAQQNIDEAL